MLKSCSKSDFHCRVPDQWTKGIINSIYKSGSDSRKNPLNYRGITLISVPSKIKHPCFTPALTLNHGVNWSFTRTVHDTLSYKDCNADRNFPRDIFLSILLYADDIALIAPDELKLQQMLDVVTSWCSEWKLHINASKTGRY
jgi:hypothetical protein